MADLMKSDSNCAADTTSDAAAVNLTMPVQPVTSSLARSSGSMQEFVEVDGTTCFIAPPAPTYRYKLSLRNGLLQIWLEDCESKKQWCTSDLTIDSYVDINNAVPGHNEANYVEHFRTLLNKTVEEAGEIPRAFKRTKDNSFRLQISVKVQVLSQTSVATYSFDMEPISVERIDVLESRMRDLQEEMRSLHLNGGRMAVVGLQDTVEKLQAANFCRQEAGSAALGELEKKPLLVERINVLEQSVRSLHGEMEALRAEGGRAAIWELQKTVRKIQAEVTSHQEAGSTAMVELEKKLQAEMSEMSFRQDDESTTVVELQETMQNILLVTEETDAEVSELHRKIKEIEMIPLTIQAEATRKTSDDDICWSATGGHSNGRDGIIRKLQPGTYQVTVTVNYTAECDGEYLQLLKGDHSVQVVFCNYNDGNVGQRSSTVLACTLSVAEGDELSVLCSARIAITSYLAMTRVGS